MGTGDAITVAVDATTTLTDLAAAINTATDDAEASVINDGTGYRLVLKSAASGAANGITVTANATTLGMPTGPVSGGQVLQAAQDAVFTIDGLPMTRSSNNVEGAISGVSITLKSEGTSTLSVTNDTGAIQEKVTAFVDAYNAVVTLVFQQRRVQLGDRDRQRLHGGIDRQGHREPAAVDPRDPRLRPFGRASRPFADRDLRPNRTAR